MIEIDSQDTANRSPLMRLPREIGIRLRSSWDVMRESSIAASEHGGRATDASPAPFLTISARDRRQDGVLDFSGHSERRQGLHRITSHGCLRRGSISWRARATPRARRSMEN